LAIEQISYLTYPEAVFLHLDHMRRIGEIRAGAFDRSLVESALARPQQAAAYEDADLIRQAATLYFGLVKNHPWLGGNKRTASLLVDEFLFRNGVEVISSLQETIALVHYIEADLWKVDEIEAWLRTHTSPLT
jgi:death-on-curing protein